MNTEKREALLKELKSILWNYGDIKGIKAKEVEAICKRYHKSIAIEAVREELKYKSCPCSFQAIEALKRKFSDD